MSPFGESVHLYEVKGSGFLLLASNGCFFLLSGLSGTPKPKALKTCAKCLTNTTKTGIFFMEGLLSERRVILRAYFAVRLPSSRLSRPVLPLTSHQRAEQLLSVSVSRNILACRGFLCCLGLEHGGNRKSE
jgi:hypothetical protein